MNYIFLYNEEGVLSMIPNSGDSMTHTSMDAFVGTVEEAKELFTAIGVNHDVILYMTGEKAAPALPSEDEIEALEGGADEQV